MRKILNIDPVRDPFSNFYRSSSRVSRGARSALLLAGLALLSAPILVGAAMATDMPMNMPMKAAAAAPVFNWTGCYVGINGGGAAAGSNFTSRVDPGTHLVDPGDLVHRCGEKERLGQRYRLHRRRPARLQPAERCVRLRRRRRLGLLPQQREIHQFNWLLGTGDTVTVTQSLRTSGLATICPRLGIVTDRTFIYATGGAAFARVNYTQAYADTLNAATGTAVGSTTLVGWTFGGGWEWAWTDHLTVKTEYLFSKFPTTNALGGIQDTAGVAERAARFLRPDNSDGPSWPELSVLTITPPTNFTHRSMRTIRMSQRISQTDREPNITTLSITHAVSCAAPDAPSLSLRPLSSRWGRFLRLHQLPRQACARGSSVFNAQVGGFPQEDDHGGRVFYEVGPFEPKSKLDRRIEGFGQRKC